MVQVTATQLGTAVQTRQYDSPNRHINPVFVSPGHQMDVDCGAVLVQTTATTYKLPDPIRYAD